MKYGLDLFVSKEEPPSIEEQYMAFFLERGISYHEFLKLPIPYILAMVRTTHYNREQSEKRQKQ